MGTGVFQIDGYFIRELCVGKDEIIVQKLCEECVDYSELCEGRPPQPDAWEGVLIDTPPGKSVEDKVILGIFEEDSLVGVIETCTNYPENGVWFIGLMMIKPEKRNCGLGERFLKGYEKWISEKGISRIMLGVLQINERAYKFWSRMGFREVRVVDNYKIGNRNTSLIVMQK